MLTLIPPTYLSSLLVLAAMICAAAAHTLPMRGFGLRRPEASCLSGCGAGEVWRTASGVFAAGASNGPAFGEAGHVRG